uniref:Tudor domain-containing protein n=1 Tax=Meloidogyne hapla TaxID=6305 RepID=A0A1I8B702_MELHA
MFYMASRQDPETNEIVLKTEDEILIAEYKARQDWRKFRPADQQQKLKLLENRPGEQLSFQPQVPPNLNPESVRFSDLSRRVVPVDDNWERFYAGISSCELYNDDKLVDELLTDMNILRIKHTAIMEGGTQVKLVLTFENDKQAVFKPMRILGYRRAVPTVGRVGTKKIN